MMKADATFLKTRKMNPDLIPPKMWRREKINLEKWALATEKQLNKSKYLLSPLGEKDGRGNQLWSEHSHPEYSWDFLFEEC